MERCVPFEKMCCLLNKVFLNRGSRHQAEDHSLFSDTVSIFRLLVPWSSCHTEGFLPPAPFFGSKSFFSILTKSASRYHYIISFCLQQPPSISSPEANYQEVQETHCSRVKSAASSLQLLTCCCAFKSTSGLVRMRGSSVCAEILLL